ncbi:hypothetical protein [Roseospirillum parvum]|uniref:Predicted lipid carrier protein YhbT, contains SCP2 domain n=1 Tax=Roseospirillum parvum TaxID=83401 RepID=A0A1G7ZP25_9PROT|nr:hypothetical protein [Roseospirillum parvum]SDH10419.1 Predicted lipid carrier protein YhbT, contains SCP2 domain [Roseospirillum parvum]
MSQGTPPPFSPFLILGIVLKPLPFALARRAARPLLDNVARDLAPRLAGRLAGLTGRVAVMPTDLPYGTLFYVGTGSDGQTALSIDLIDTRHPVEAEARVRAPTSVLLELTHAQGHDGDASFFSRSLIMEGDTSLSMAFRYGLEEAELTSGELAAMAAPLPGDLGRRLGQALEGLIDAASADASRVQEALLAPLSGRLNRLEKAANRLREDVDQVLKSSPRRRPASQASGA